MNKLLVKLCGAGNLVIQNSGFDDEYLNVVMTRPPIVFRVDGCVGGYLVAEISCAVRGYDREIQEIVAIITEVMGANPLLCIRLDIPDEGVDLGVALGCSRDALENTGYRHYEWEVLAPEAHLRRVMNDVRDPSYEDYLQAELFNGRDALSYQDADLTARYQKADELHQAFAGAYGLDPITLDYPRIEDGNSLELYLMYLIAEANAEENGGASEASNLRCDYLKRVICGREQISISEPSAAQRLEVGEDFQAWCAYFEQYLEQHDKAWREKLTDAYCRHQDLTPFMPMEDWRKVMNK